ncbi:MAG: PD40 domain-containing protein [Acidobacteriaceae bacterium]|nr:PD40 domain-containing protein [Acidobacteriaceae bacterium]MBV9780910.1 PD40 domain-containing protein [Acidobacteriaceae bacterium]
MVDGITRRALLAVLPGGLAAASTVQPKKPLPVAQPGEFVRFIDPATETTVVRLTSPVSTSLLPAPGNRFISSKRRFLIFASDRTGKATPFQLDLRTGRLRQLAQTENLLPHSLCMDETQRFLYLLDRTTLTELSLANLKIRTLGEEISAFSSVKSGSEIVIVKQGRLARLSDPSTVLADGLASSVIPLIRPNGTGCFFSREVSVGDREFWYVSFNIAGSKPILLAKGSISNPLWSPDSSSLLFLRNVQTNVVVSELHEVLPETSVERRLASTSQFAAFAPNGDASVFVGASRSKAQPNIVLLLRSVQRELTLCEHRASQPSGVSPVFSPDSRRVYFQSDHQGKSALYSVNVETLVEPTPAYA